MSITARIGEWIVNLNGGVHRFGDTPLHGPARLRESRIASHLIMREEMQP